VTARPGATTGEPGNTTTTAHVEQGMEHVDSGPPSDAPPGLATSPLSPEHEASVADMEAQIGLLVRRARLYGRSVTTALDPSLDPAAYGILLRLSSVGAERTTDLAAFLGIGKPTTSRQLTQLVALGLVERTDDPVDRRASLVRLTAEGRARFAAQRDQRRGLMRERLAEWDVEDVRTLAHLLGRFNDV
jgi:DNA-binding MarR family transcriptional regulator